MKSGTASLELEITLNFHDDGTQSGLRTIAIDGVAMPEHVSTFLWRYLRDLKPADAIVEAAWDDAEDDGDGDAACEEAREVS